MPKVQKTSNDANSPTMINGNGFTNNGEIMPAAPRPSLTQHRQVHPIQNKMINQQLIEQNYSNDAQMQNSLYLQKQQQLAQHLNAQQQLQQNGNNKSSQQFHPTHRRARPLSILYKPPPVITTQPENV